MGLNEVVRARIDSKTKEDAEAVLAEIGLTLSDVIRLLLIRVAREGALPFDPFVPNKETIAAMQEARADLIKVGSVDRLIAELNADDPEDEEIQEGLQAGARGTVRRRA
ncbi:type II toxin-antitoxin system RelB/DinJ family antitoxin [Rhodomicrobium sp.]|uniref:type II toxin-antitoxin system RelB/DinJ family antitoxin n=1 Tax=Rhodomicrobium sp. TaxID=2720632 RepID=UPI0039E60BD8